MSKIHEVGSIGEDTAIIVLEARVQLSEAAELLRGPMGAARHLISHYCSGLKKKHGKMFSPVKRDWDY